MIFEMGKDCAKSVKTKMKVTLAYHFFLEIYVIFTHQLKTRAGNHNPSALIERSQSVVTESLMSF